MDLMKEIQDRLDLLKTEQKRIAEEIEDMGKMLEMQKIIKNNYETSLGLVKTLFDDTVKASSIKAAPVVEIEDPITEELTYKPQIEVILERSREGLKGSLKSTQPVTTDDKLSMHDYFKNLIEKPNSIYRKIDDVWIKHRPDGVTVIRLVEGLYTETRYKKGETYSTMNPKVKKEEPVKEQSTQPEPVSYDW